eukprot:1016523-Rhodomonas_salina.1
MAKNHLISFHFEVMAKNHLISNDVVTVLTLVDLSTPRGRLRRVIRRLTVERELEAVRCECAEFSGCQGLHSRSGHYHLPV